MLRARDYRSYALSSLQGIWGKVYLKVFLCAIVGLVFRTLSGILYPAPPLDFTNLQAYLDYTASNEFRMARLIIFAGTLISMGIAIANNWVYLQAANKKDPDWKGFTASLKRFFESFIFSLLLAVRVFLWALLFIIPGIIKGFAYAMAIYIKIENPQMSSNEAINKSNEMMKGNKWRLFCLLFSFIGWWLLAGIVISVVTMFIDIPFLVTIIDIAVALLVTIYSQCAVAHFYRSLKHQSSAENAYAGE